MDTTKIKIYIATHCNNNPGPAGFCLVLVDADRSAMRNILYGGSNFSTPNRVELTALKNALALALNYEESIIYTNSEYVTGVLSNIMDHRDHKFSGVGHSELWTEICDLMFSGTGKVTISDHCQFSRDDKLFYDLAQDHSKVVRDAEEIGIDLSENIHEEASED